MADVKLDISSAFSNYLKSGDWNKFLEDMATGMNSTMMDALQKVFLESGPIAKATEHWTSQLTAETSKALKDGVISPEEEEALKKLAGDAKKGIGDAVNAVKPAIDALRGVFSTSIGGSFSAGIDSAINDFAQGGTIGDFKTAVNQSVYDGVMSGVVSGIMATGPIKDAMDTFSSDMGDLMSSAMEDGVLTGAESDAIGALGTKLSEQVGPLLDAMGPALQGLAGKFGVGLSGGAQRIKDVLGGGISSAFADATQADNKNTGFGAFQKNARNAIYLNIRDGLINAFMESAVMQGLLAGPLGVIDDIFKKIGNNQLTIAEANVALGQQVAAINGALASPALAQMFNQVSAAIGQVGTGLGATADKVEEAAPAVEQAAEASEQACKAEYKLEVANLGLAQLNTLGRQGGLTVESFVPVNPDKIPRLQHGGIAMRHMIAQLAETGPEAIIPLSAMNTLKAGLGGADLGMQGLMGEMRGGAIGSVGGIVQHGMMNTLKAALGGPDLGMQGLMGEMRGGFGGKGSIGEVVGQLKTTLGAGGSFKEALDGMNKSLSGDVSNSMKELVDEQRKTHSMLAEAMDQLTSRPPPPIYLEGRQLVKGFNEATRNSRRAGRTVLSRAVVR